jgi:hypothetical protein
MTTTQAQPSRETSPHPTQAGHRQCRVREHAEGSARKASQRRVLAGVSSFPYGLGEASPQVARGIRPREEPEAQAIRIPLGTCGHPWAGRTGVRARPVLNLILGGLPSGEDIVLTHTSNPAKARKPAPDTATPKGLLRSPTNPIRHTPTLPGGVPAPVYWGGKIKRGWRGLLWTTRAAVDNWGELIFRWPVLPVVGSRLDSGGRRPSGCRQAVRR